ncbi:MULTISPECIES: tRNA (adenosine(37)-N6)-dimethylallyltransferase MiaA [unclassified Barnesiella]|uniref:tRNA (adenosine(37)-N6)-dimethylallyltransferase MiaA n=1 Tax=unclassified Barnesiella TaxID=2645177 RepID=UPI000B3846C6|nr:MULTISPECIES: tRNA (adenosine(37)-N6)-dimethylallyltransferase MiaA [unclassified Barnesiella]MCR8912366.1 tRNA (adenosine(37)-N6)-dimethylallyltransferase MiaA [Barnesiella sp. ET7]OUO96208.1 tRNA (adenosine(37)-N6)-dimethylallyltransferase MiaA [Barnesiella sp. An22]
MAGTLLVLTGPTGVGKTELSLQLAEHYGAPIISADSRQFYRDIPIGTAAPTAEQLARVKHYFVGQLALTDYYSASCYEEEVLRLLDTLFQEHAYVLLTGGSMMYIDAVCKGIDEIPTITDEVRREVLEHYHRVGLEALCEELRERDPVYYGEVDLKNHKRVIHAIEICRQTGGRYSDLRTRQVKQRPFRIVKIGLIRPREELFDRIARRTEQMMADGLLDEARRVYPLRHLNSLNTVGYKELFACFDGTMTLDQAIEKIKRNTRVYSKKQVTWYKKDPDMHWFSPDDKEAIIEYIDGCK